MNAIMPEIEHIVVLMLENRSLDNVLGWLYADQGNRPGLTVPAPPAGKSPMYFGLEAGKYALPLRYKGKTQLYPVVRGTCGNGLDVPSLDPWEEYTHVTNQLFGGENHVASPTPDPACALPARMLGFLQDFTESYLQDDEFVDKLRDLLTKELGEVVGAALWQAIQALPPEVRSVSLQTWNQSLQILQTFGPEDLPVLNGLARHYAVSDLWFASVPSQTNPNRAFFTCGTSLGRESNSNINADEHFEAPTVWNVLRRLANSRSCAVYYQVDFPPASGKCYTDYTFPFIRAANVPFLRMDQFYAGAEKGALPNFSFVEPAWGWGINKDFKGFKGAFVQGDDYHPPTSARQGEAFVKKVYDSLINSPLWPKTLLVVTFDEHGGTFDHVPPPCPAPRPDGHVGEHKFKFDRYGVRVPTILVTPWTEAGTVFRSEVDLPYDHTSLTATILKWAGIDPATPDPDSPAKNSTPWLGKRVAVAPTFENALNRTAPRTDKPDVRLPLPASSTPITVRNETPAQIYVHFAWGPEIDLPMLKGRRPYVSGWPRYVQPGESATYDAEGSLDRKLFDYYVAASYRVGDPNAIPPDLVDSVFGVDNNWRLFWNAWKLITHHQVLTMTQAAPAYEISEGGPNSPIIITNSTPATIYAHLVYDALKVPVLGWPQYVSPGRSASFDPSGDWLSHDYFIKVSYWVGEPNTTPHGLVDTFFGVETNWRLLWEGWKQIGHHQTLIVRQPEPTVDIRCPR